MSTKRKKAFGGNKKTPEILQAMCLQELSEATGNDVSHEPWSGRNVDVAPAAQATEVPKTKPAPFKGLSDFADVESQAKHLGYSIGDIVYEKKFEQSRYLLTGWLPTGQSNLSLRFLSKSLHLSCALTPSR